MHYVADRINTTQVKEIIAAYTSEQLRGALQSKYGAVPTFPTTAAAARPTASSAATSSASATAVGDKITKEMLTAFYKKHDPQSVPRVDAIIAA